MNETFLVTVTRTQTLVFVVAASDTEAAERKIRNGEGTTIVDSSNVVDYQVAGPMRQAQAAAEFNGA